MTGPAIARVFAGSLLLFAAATAPAHAAASGATADGRTIAASAQSIGSLGANDFNAYCQRHGAQRAALAEQNAYGWRCMDNGGGTNRIDVRDVCADANGTGTGRVIDRVGDYNNPGSWQCWSLDRGELGGVDLRRYCESMGQQVSLDGSTAYDWHCSRQAIDMHRACQSQYGDGAIDSMRDYNNVYSWRCYA